MTVSKETNLGTITVSNLLFAQIIAESFRLEPCEGRVWPATKRGKQIGSDQKFSLSEFAGCIEAVASFNGESADLSFSIIVKFGVSIRRITDVIGDYVAERVCEKLGKKPSQITIRIAGVKSRQVARRNLEVIKRYGIA